MFNTILIKIYHKKKNITNLYASYLYLFDLLPQVYLMDFKLEIRQNENEYCHFNVLRFLQNTKSISKYRLTI